MISKIHLAYLFYRIRKGLGYSCPLVWWVAVIKYLCTGKVKMPKGWILDPAVTNRETQQ